MPSWESTFSSPRGGGSAWRASPLKNGDLKPFDHLVLCIGWALCSGRCDGILMRWSHFRKHCVRTVFFEEDLVFGQNVLRVLVFAGHRGRGDRRLLGELVHPFRECAHLFPRLPCSLACLCSPGVCPAFFYASTFSPPEPISTSAYANPQQQQSSWTTLRHSLPSCQPRDRRGAGDSLIHDCMQRGVCASFPHGMHFFHVCFSSQLGFLIAVFLWFVVFILDDTWYMLNVLSQSIGYHFQWLMQVSVSVPPPPTPGGLGHLFAFFSAPTPAFRVCVSAMPRKTGDVSLSVTAVAPASITCAERM